MGAYRLFTSEEVARRLREFGAVKLSEEDGGDSYHSYSYWRTSWKHHFTVPQIGPDRLCSQSALEAILADLLERSKDQRRG